VDEPSLLSPSPGASPIGVDLAGRVDRPEPGQLDLVARLSQTLLSRTDCTALKFDLNAQLAAHTPTERTAPREVVLGLL
jgi:hypothetical protein